MRRLYLARDRIEAQFLCDFLDRHLIRTLVLGDLLAGAAGELPADISPSLWVIDDQDLDRARELLARFVADAAAPPEAAAGPPWVCSACGETVEADFDLCWNCTSPRPPGFSG